MSFYVAELLLCVFSLTRSNKPKRISCLPCEISICAFHSNTDEWFW